MKVVDLLEVVERSPTKLILQQQPGLDLKAIVLFWAFIFVGAPLLLIVSQEDKPWKVPLLVTISFLGIIVLGTLVLTFRSKTYIFEREVNI
jgi:hypothetical protein